MKQILQILSMTLLLCIVPISAGAEVMDKEPTLTAIWSYSLAGAILGFFLCRWRAWFILIVLPLALIFPFAVNLELSDPYVGPAILNGAGKTYQIQVYLAIVIIVIANVTGVIVRLVTHKRKLVKGI